MKDLNRSTIDVKQTLPVKIIQFGEGNFLRAFVDWIVDILNEQTDFKSGITVVQPIENGMVDLLDKQDGLYHVLLNGIQGGRKVEKERLITCITGTNNPYKNYDSFLKLAENPDLQFVISNTTEAGISFDPSDTEINTLPKSFPGKLTALLYQRFKFFQGARDKGLYIIPCELIEKNGEKLKEVLLKNAQHMQLGEEYANWISGSNIFCNTLVDRIVPGFPKDNIQQIQEKLNYKDNLVVKAEPFHLWVIEAPDEVKKAFPADKAGLEVKFVDDLTPYRTRKVRILNGAHTALVPVAYLEGLRTVKESVDDKETGKFLREVIFEEIIPTLDLPPEELQKFSSDVIERFQNPFIRHELISIALNSISKYKVRVLPSVLEYFKRKNALPERLLQSLAALIVFYRGYWKGEKIPLSDTSEIISFFRQVWENENVNEVVDQVLSNNKLWDADLTEIKGLASLVKQDVQHYLDEENAKQVKSA